DFHVTGVQTCALPIFEIRDSKTENIINPLFFGFDELIADTKKPNINNVYVYPVGENSHANNSENPTSVPLSLQKDGTYLAQTVRSEERRVGKECGYRS